jgi:hypothetical protein
MRPNQLTPLPGETITEDDLKGSYRAMFNAIMQHMTGKGLKYEDRRYVALAKVKQHMDRQAKKAAAEKKQLTLFPKG